MKGTLCQGVSQTHITYAFVHIKRYHVVWLDLPYRRTSLTLQLLRQGILWSELGNLKHSVESAGVRSK